MDQQSQNLRADTITKLHERGVSFMHQFLRTGDLAHISEAISTEKQALMITPEGHPAMRDELSILGLSLYLRSEQAEITADIDEAISVLTKAVLITREGHPDLHADLNSLGLSYQSRFIRAGNVSDLVEAISAFRRAVQHTPTNNPAMHSELSNLGLSLIHLFQRTNNLSHITESIAILRKAATLTPVGHPGRPGSLSNLGLSLMRRFERLGDMVDIGGSISTQELALQLTPIDDADLPARFNSLGAAYLTRFEHTDALSDITKAVALTEKAVDLTSDDHPSKASYINNLGLSLKHRFLRAGNVSDIDAAVRALRKAIDLTQDGHIDVSTWYNNLGLALMRRFERIGDDADVVEAIDMHERAFELIPESHADRPGWLTNLGLAYLRRFENTVDPTYIEKSVPTLQKAVDLTPEGRVELPSLLNSLGVSLMRRFELAGDLSDIGDAIAAQQRAVQLTPDGHADLPRWLANLGNSFGVRFQRSSTLMDIEEAISALQRAVRLTPDGHTDLPSRLSDLGNALSWRFERNKNPSDIDEAIQSHRRAVKETPDGHASLPGWLSNLGMALQIRFQLTNNSSHNDEAISVLERAVYLAPESQAGLRSCLSNYGLSLQDRFKRTAQPTDRDTAILALKKAVILTPEGHADRPGNLSNLARVLYRTSVPGSDDECFEESISHFKSAATCIVGSPEVRLTAATNWARLQKQHRPQDAEILTAFDTALGLTALMAGLEDTVRGRYSRLQGVSGLPLEAAAAAFSLSRPDKALEWLEQGRCLVWSQLSDLRTPFGSLHSINEALAKSIADVAKKLENAGSSRISSHTGMSFLEKIATENEARVHLSLARQWDELLASARAIPGFESFLQPSPCSALMQHLPDGPVVIINVNKARCDAIALVPGRDEPLHVPLPDFSVTKAQKYHIYLRSQLRSVGLRAREEEEVVSLGEDRPERAIKPVQREKTNGGPVYDVLRGMWSEVVKPILDVLGFSRVDQSVGQVPPRIWWCPTGELSFLPIHAAGIYDGLNREGTMDYVTSSYTPTVAALAERIKAGPTPSGDPSGLFLTSQPNAPGSPPIPGTTKEVQMIYAKARGLGTRALMVEGRTLTVDACVKHMEAYRSVHFACHASQNAADPLQSRFLLEDGPLDLATIIRLNLKHADLAFLSACQTSSGEEKLSDEAVHLAAGMLAAGYRRVVATMWSIGDERAQEVACDFYDYLWSSGAGAAQCRKFDGTASAHALHRSTQQLRLRLDDSESSLLTWIPYVHYGH